MALYLPDELLPEGHRLRAVDLAAAAAARSSTTMPHLLRPLDRHCSMAGSAGGQVRLRAERKCQRPKPAMATPTRAMIGPRMAHTDVPDMKLPPMTPTPCKAKMTPAIVTIAPTPISKLLFIIGPVVFGSDEPF